MSRINARVIAIIASVTALVTLSVFSFFTLRSWLRPYTVMFYDLSPTEIEQYSALFPKTTRVLSKTGTEPINAQDVRRADCVILPNGAPLIGLAEGFEAIPAKILATVPPSLRASVPKAGNQARALPLQLDHFEIAWEYGKFGRLGLRNPETLAALAEAMKKHGNTAEPALLFAGKDDETLLALISSLCASYDGYAGYESARQALGSGKGLADLGGTPLFRAIETLSDWYRSGYFHPEWFNLTEADVRHYMTENFGFIVFGSLTFHRTVEYQTIYKYSSGRFPPAVGSQSDAIVAPMTVFAAKPRSKFRTLTDNIIARLIMGDTGRALATATGKATALSAARAPDVQAADVLAWAAGTPHVVNGLYRDAFVDRASAAAFSEEVRNAILGR